MHYQCLATAFLSGGNMLNSQLVHQTFPNLLNLVAVNTLSWSTIYSYLDFDLKNSSFRLPYQRPCSSTNCVRELFNSSNGSASL